MPLSDLNKTLVEMPARLALPLRDGGAFDVTVRPPGSKSLTNRAVLLGAMAGGETVIRGALRGADDSEAMRRALVALGAGIDEDTECTRVRGVDGVWRSPAEGITLNLNNAGTAARFLAGAALLAPGPVTIDGNARMRERPIGELAGMLRQLGCGVTFGGKDGCPPVTIVPPGSASAEGVVLDVPTTLSSQFVSALLLAAPWIKGGITLRMVGTITSGSYVQMTLGLLSRLGACVQTSDRMRVIRVRGAWREESEEHPVHRGIPAFSYDVEPDASGATYFWGAAAMVPGATVLVPGLDERSLQGDTGFAELMGRMGATVAARDGGIAVTGGVLRPVLADMADMPDAAMTLAVVACFAEGTSILKGVGTLRVKECDRIEAMRVELGKLGVRVESPVSGDDGAMTVTPPAGGIDCGPGAAEVAFDTYDDHRIAMALSLLSLRRPNVVINNPACVAKTYPGYWREFARLF